MNTLTDTQRQRQLVRQWKILKYLAQRTDKNVDCQSVALMLDVHPRTIYRDIKSLFKAGFIDNVPVRWNDPVELSQRQRALRESMYVPLVERAIVAQIEGKIVSDKLKRVDLTRCNACEYPFKLNEHGVLDMKDFQKHKKKCGKGLLERV